MTDGTKVLDGRTALVTGGNSGIGYAAAEALLRAGARVVITGRNAATLEAAAARLGAVRGTDQVLALRADTTSAGERAAAFAAIRERFGGLDVLFANAGIARFAPVEGVTEADYDEQFGVNVRGLFFTIQEALPLLRDGASVILNASISGQKGLPGASVYSATKAAVRSFARTLSADLLPRRIRVNAVSPGPISTPIFERMGMPQEAIDQTTAYLTSLTPVKRMGAPEEVAALVVYLASDASSYIVGADIAIDGGVTQL